MPGLALLRVSWVVFIAVKTFCWAFAVCFGGGAMVLGKLPVPGRPTIWIIVGQGPAALVVGAGGGCLDIFSLIYLPLFGRRPDID